MKTLLESSAGKMPNLQCCIFRGKTAETTENFRVFFSSRILFPRFLFPRFFSEANTFFALFSAVFDDFPVFFIGKSYFGGFLFPRFSLRRMQHCSTCVRTNIQINLLLCKICFESHETPRFMVQLIPRGIFTFGITF